jgi:hypothetical protein
LALIFPLLERMNISKIINQHIPADDQAEFDHGSVLSLLVAARLYSPVALTGVAEWAAESAADILWGIPPEKINDDRLGRSLDAFFTQRHSILASLALHVEREFKVPLKDVHYDPTHILLRGAYDTAEKREPVVADSGTRSDHTLAAAHIAPGRATADAPLGALMIHAGLCTHVDEFGPLPFFGHTTDGNQNGHTAVAEQLALLRKHLPLPQLTMISDRGTFLSQEENLEVVVLHEGDARLLNIYHVMQVNPDRSDKLNEEGAAAFVEFMVSDEAQSIIREFGVDRFGQPLFIPDAGKSEAELGSP